jgi:hypothetical protein
MNSINIKGAELMGQLHDALLANGYSGHELEVLLVRLLFCLFAEDTTIFEKFQFTDYIDKRTAVDGSDLGIHLAQLFEVLNTPPDQRLKNLDEQLGAFEYVNGALFAERLHFAAFDRTMRDKLLMCCYFDWSKISPAIFGSMFQSVMDTKARRNLGAHYTSEKNILKLIRGLFLDELEQKFEQAKSNKSKLKALHAEISEMKFLDPACGCGNFLIITYRELRLLEIEILKILQKGQTVTQLEYLIQVNVDTFYGIEFEEFPAQIAQVAMWLMDHQMNMLMSVEFGHYYKRLPLKKSATIVHGNALRIDWQSLLNPINTVDVVAKHTNIYLVNEPAAEYKTVNIETESYQIHQGKMPKAPSEITFDYILGNPPFVGKNLMNESQSEDMELIFHNVKGSGLLDYVTAWYWKAANYMIGINTKAAFVSTNSISQGEQVGVLWSELFKYGIKIFFAHRTFKWSNEASGKAAVHVVIIGFTSNEVANKGIYDYENLQGEPSLRKVNNINPYLVSASNIFIAKRREPICKVPAMAFGSMPNDGGHLLMSDDEKKSFLAKEPNAKKFVRRFIGSEEFINNIKKWCLWLVDANPSELKKLPEVLLRINSVRESRLKSKREATRRLAESSMLFGEIRQPTSRYLVFPEVSSERRKYIPLGFVEKEVISSNKNYTIAGAKIYHFGILHSLMHKTWVDNVCGRLKSDYQYSTGIVYNNFPWPENLPKQKVAGIEKLASQILKVRERYPASSLADLYDPLIMPPDLLKAHQDLDKFVDGCYRPQPFDNETQRIEFLFDLYQKYMQPLFGSEKKSKKKSLKQYKFL